MTLRGRRLIIAAPIAELLAVVTIMVPSMITFATLDATVTMRMIEMQRLAVWTAPVAGFLACLLGGWWVARRASGDHTRNGLVLGIAVAIVDLALLLAAGAPLGALLVGSIDGRVAGGYCGGLVAGRYRRAPSRASISESASGLM
jgi:hypothetical protein